MPWHRPKSTPERRSPEARSVADRDAADRIDDGKCGDADAVTRRCRGRPKAALEVGGGGAETRADAAEREVGARGCCGGVAEIAIGREATPFFIAAVEQIEADGAWHDGNDGVADRKTAPLFRKPGLHAAAGFDAEGRAAGKREPVDAFDGVDGVEQGGVARTRSTAADVHGHDGRSVEHDRRDAGREARIVGVADLDARDIGEQVFHYLTSFGAAGVFRYATFSGR